MSLINKIIRPDILKLTSYQVPSADNMVKLDAMENPYGLPAELKKELGARLAKVALNRYPVPAYRELKNKICCQFGVPTGYDVILGNGSDELITLLSVACSKPGAKVMAPVPTFVMYAISAKLVGLEFIGVPLQADLGLDMPAMLLAIQQHRPSLLYLSNPNNPTGSWFDEEQLLQLIHAMADIGLVIVDEAYQPFAPGSMMPHLPSYAHLVVMRTVSKIGLAGLRLGYMSASGDILAEIDKVRPPYNVNVLTEAAAQFLLDHISVFDQQARQICEQRSKLILTLEKIPGIVVFPSEANFVLIRVPDSELIFNNLLKHKILIKNVGKMHALLANCLRVTVSTPEENELFIGALLEALKQG